MESQAIHSDISGRRFVRDKIESFFDDLFGDTPFEWDTAGVQLRLNDEYITGFEEEGRVRIAFALGCGESVLKKLEEYRKNKRPVDILFLHHPLVFSGMKKFDLEVYPVSALFKLAKLGVDLYIAHVNLDSSIFGASFLAALHVAKWLSENGLKVSLGTPTSETLITQEDFANPFRLGSYAVSVFIREGEVTFNSLVSYLEEFYNARPRFDSSLLLDKRGERLKAGDKILFCSGSASSVVYGDYKLLVTGEVGYHPIYDSFQQSRAVVCFGHYESERMCVQVVKNFVDWLINRRNVPLSVIFGEKVVGCDFEMLGLAELFTELERTSRELWKKWFGEVKLEVDTFFIEDEDAQF